MQSTSDLYNSIRSGRNYRYEVAVSIGPEYGGFIVGEDMVKSVKTQHNVFKNNVPTAGCAIAGECTVVLQKPDQDIPKMARLEILTRITDGERTSEWIQKGIYFVDTRSETKNTYGPTIITLHGYDAMLMFEEDYPSDTEHDYPLSDIEILRFLAYGKDVGLDTRTIAAINKGYTFPLPVGYSSREVLSAIAGAYGGNFVISDRGELLFIGIGALPEETHYLVTQNGDPITFGGVRILI